MVPCLPCLPVALSLSHSLHIRVLIHIKETSKRDLMMTMIPLELVQLIQTSNVTLVADPAASPMHSATKAAQPPRRRRPNPRDIAPPSCRWGTPPATKKAADNDSSAMTVRNCCVIPKRSTLSPPSSSSASSHQQPLSSSSCMDSGPRLPQRSTGHRDTASILTEALEIAAL